MMSFTTQEIEEFKTEARELLDTAEKSLLALGDGSDFKSCYDDVFRSFHNLKGASGMMEMLELQTHTHELENILMGLKGHGEIPKDYISFFLSGIDGARTLLNGQSIQFSYSIGSATSPPALESEKGQTQEVDSRVQSSSPPQDHLVETSSAILEFFAECDEIICRISADLKSIETEVASTEILNNLYRDMHSLKGASYLFGFASVGDIAHAMESAMEPVRSLQRNPDKNLLDLLYKAVSAVEGEIEAIKSNSPPLKNAQASEETCAQLIQWAENDAPRAQNNPTDVKVASLKQKGEPIENPVVNQGMASPPVAKIEATTPKDAELNSSIRVPVALLDNLMTLVGEMVLVRNQVLQFSSRSEDLEFLMLSKRLNSVTSEIQGEMLKTRMQAIGNILTKFHRVVRDLSEELKKEINMVVTGAETELDKTLLEAIKDPITHIVRNSCDHGIELPEIRQRAGKVKNGTINIKSYHEGGQVVIEISDDGKGLNKDVLIKKGIEKGLISHTQIPKLSDKEIFELIFAPGFSTAASVTNVSGRGVGMDVVRTNIERIGGTVELSSAIGAGTKTKLKIPLTLAIVPALIIKCGQGAYAIPQIKLEQLVRVDQASTDARIEFLLGAPVFRLRGDILPLIDLNKVLGMGERVIGEDTVSNVAVLNADGFSFGLIVDEVLDTADIVVKPLTKLLKSLQVYSGATILGDGSIALILDVMGLSKVANLVTDRKVSENIVKAKHQSEFQDFLIVRLNSPTKHAIVLGFVHRLEEFKRSAIETSGNQRVIRYGNHILPLISCNEHLNFNGPSEVQSEMTPVVVIQKAGLLYGMEVNEIVDTLSTDLEASPSVIHQKGIFGNINTPDGIIVVVDTFELINSAFPDLAVASPRAVIHENKSRLSKEAHQDSVLKRILLVEDTVFFRKTVADVLTKAGYSISTANDGKEALEMILRSPKDFDLIISDIEMPRMNGFELAMAIRSNMTLGHLPLLALSSRADKKYTDQGLLSGFDMYLEKLKPVILLDGVEQLISSRRRAS